MRRRLDTELVRRGLVPSRSRAESAIAEGRVLVSGSVALKAARLVAPGEPVELTTPRRFVSRGGEKLEGALDRFGLDVHGRRCLDAGASTGGFTDCLLQRGAVGVVAVDVGRGQLDASLRDDERVRAFEGSNLRHVGPRDVGGPFEVVTADLSFISLTAVAASLAPLLDRHGDAVLLVKPQFEAGPERVGRGGVVRDPDVHADVLRRCVGSLREHGLVALAVAPSPIRGPAGNVEYFVWCRHADADGDACASDPVGAPVGDAEIAVAVGEGVEAR